MAKILLAASYVADWAVLIVVAIVGYIVGNITPNHRPFSLDNTDISFPFTVYETVTTSTLILASVLAPAVITAFVCLVFVPGGTVPCDVPRSLVWRRKLWEFHAAWLGLAFSVAIAWFVMSGMKNLFGKPRPDLLARCQPDLDNIAQYVVGGIATMSGGSGQLVSSKICQTTGTANLDEGFRSFPSGHATISAAGLLYLTLVLASKFGAASSIFARVTGRGADYSAFPSRLHPVSDACTQGTRLSQEAIELNRGDVAVNSPHKTTPARKQAAAPPIYLFALALAPFLAAVFISASRWFDFRHHGFDILFGFTIGTITAICAFRYYHMPFRGGAGWAWAPRTEDKAWWAGVGYQDYATRKGEYLRHRGDEEAGML
ncbi:hypothetical protein SBRCBS47491_009482 [Sporothrix bragantina]|uniref:Phosphatidic acid phosphatase type 2/haloperoxidase domain-containing protein n=1 Tax=Sporothrix bragantina TaxID=671064 RepID=A0ABP0CVB6_9PEZI